MAAIGHSTVEMLAALNNHAATWRIFADSAAAARDDRSGIAALITHGTNAFPGDMDAALALDTKIQHLQAAHDAVAGSAEILTAAQTGFAEAGGGAARSATSWLSSHVSQLGTTQSLDPVGLTGSRFLRDAGKGSAWFGGSSTLATGIATSIPVVASANTLGLILGSSVAGASAITTGIIRWTEHHDNHQTVEASDLIGKLRTGVRASIYGSAQGKFLYTFQRIQYATGRMSVRGAAEGLVPIAAQAEQIASHMESVSKEASSTVPMMLRTADAVARHDGTTASLSEQMRTAMEERVAASRAEWAKTIADVPDAAPSSS